MSDTKQASTAGEHTLRPDRTRLFEIASEQSGYFTAGQARTCGFSWALLSHHVKSGRFVRARRGLYRFREYPSSPREHVLAAWLAVGKAISFVSHESALDLLGLSDLIPDAVHLTVSRSRRNLPSMPGVKVHTTIKPLRSDDLVVRDGMVATSATRSIVDAAEAGTAPDQIQAGVIEAVRRGLATPQQLRRASANRGRRVVTLIEEALDKVQQ